jgi:hypothetical protein
MIQETQTTQDIWEGGPPSQYKVRWDGGLSKLYEGFDWLKTMEEAQHRIWSEFGMRAGWEGVEPEMIFGKHYDWEAPEHCWTGDGIAPKLTITYWRDIDTYLIGLFSGRVKDGYYYPGK